MPIYKMDGKKDGKQQYRVRVNYVDQFGKPRQIDRVAYGSTEAKDLERRLHEEIKKTPPAARKTLKDLYDEYIEVCKHELRETTWDKKRRTFEHTIIPLVGDIKLDKFNVVAAQKYKSDILALGLSPATSSTYIKVLSTMINYAVRMEYIPKNPLRQIGGYKTPEFAVPEKKVRYYTSDEFLRYIAVAKQRAEASGDLDEWGYYIFFMLAFYTGMRKGEIHALQWADIDGNVIKIRRSISQKIKGKRETELLVKTLSSVRDVQMPQPLVAALDDHRKRQQIMAGFNDHWFVCRGVGCLRDSTIEKRNQAFAEVAGLPHRTIHEFRHSHASLLANSGINIQEVARRLGHKNVTITWNTYSHLYPREEEHALEILNKIV
nr:MAG TPA: Integrase [Caudoviricetes sp.]